MGRERRGTEGRMGKERGRKEGREKGNWEEGRDHPNKKLVTGLVTYIENRQSNLTVARNRVGINVGCDTKYR